MSLSLELKPFSSYFHLSHQYIVCHVNNFTVEDYLYGRCHLFALVLNSITNLDIAFYKDNNEYPPRLLHAFCVLEDKVIDARGMIYIDEITDDYGIYNSQLVNGDYAKEHIEKAIEKGFLDDFSPYERQSLCELVETMINGHLIKY